MNIYIIANYTNSQTSRFVELAGLFYANGHYVTLITSDFCHNTKKTKSIMDQYEGFQTIYIHEPGYPGNVSPQRLWSHYIWGLNVEKYLKNLQELPDMVYAALPTFTAGRLVGKWCNKHNVKYVVDVQDLWPEAFKVAIKNTIIQMAFKPMDWIANAAYKSADYVIAVSDTYRDRALSVNKKCKEGLTVYLGNNGETFDYGREHYHVNKPDGEFWIAYIGTMGYSYDIKLAIDAIKHAEEGNLPKKVKFIGMGRGPLLEEYKEYAENSGIAYEFTGPLDYEVMVGKMCSCDAVINCLRPGAAQSITNKVGDYALSGLPVINTQENVEYRKLVEEWNCGINCECGNVQDTAKAIEKLVKNPSLCEEMGRNSRRLGEMKFDRRTTYLDIVKLLDNIK